MSALKNDYYQFDPVRQCLIGDRTHNEYGLGDAISVRVVSVDMDQRKIEFDLMQTDSGKKKTRNRSKRKN
jgi:ribonuclease R